MEYTICNPMNLEYRFSQTSRLGKCTVHREGADPSIILYKNRYYLFPSMSAGFWHSDNLLDWTYKINTQLPYYDYAPDIREIDNHLYFTASRRKENCPIYRVKDPLTDNFELVSQPFPFWDPHLFQDDDGKVYFYWGCSASTPIRGIQMDRDTLKPIGDETSLISGNKEQHGWERVGENNDPKQIKGIFSKIIQLITKGNP